MGLMVSSTMARNGVKETLLISSVSFLKNLCLLITIPIMFLSNILHTIDLFNKKKSKSYLHDQEELQAQGEETETNLDEEEDGLIEISLRKEVEKRWISKEEYYKEMTIMEILEEIEAEDNLIEIDVSIGSIV